jgi:hypothetical protein
MFGTGPRDARRPGGNDHDWAARFSGPPTNSTSQHHPTTLGAPPSSSGASYSKRSDPLLQDRESVPRTICTRDASRRKSDIRAASSQRGEPVRPHHHREELVRTGVVLGGELGIVGVVADAKNQPPNPPSPEVVAPTEWQRVQPRDRRQTAGRLRALEGIKREIWSVDRGCRSRMPSP